MLKNSKNKITSMLCLLKIIFKNQNFINQFQRKNLFF